MLRKILPILSLLGATAVVSCAFIRDFDELQAGGPIAGAAGTAAAGGAAGAAGSACEACDDHDPCTRDTCVADGTCHHYSNGAILDGVDATIGAGTAQAVTLTGSAQRFYAAVVTGDAAASTVTLYSLGPADDTPVLGPTVQGPRGLGGGTLRAVPGAAVALVAQTDIPNHVLAYAAVTETGSVGSVWRFTLSPTLQPVPGAQPERLSAANRDDYLMAQRGPIAWQMGSTVHGAWIGDDGTTIHLNSTGQLLNRSLGNGSTAVQSIAPLGNGTDPGVLWLGAGTPAQGFGQVVGALAPSLLALCPAEGQFLSASTSHLTGGVWIASMTRALTDGITDELRMLGCAGTACTVSDSGCGQQPSAGMYDAVTALQQSPSETQVAYEAVLTPQYLGPTEVAAYFQVIRIDFGTDPVGARALFPDLSGLEVARVASAVPLAIGSPSVAFSGTDRVAVAWIQPAAAGGPPEARIQRYQLCPFTADDLAAAP
jgi:hypothetical protein